MEIIWRYKIIGKENAKKFYRDNEDKFDDCESRYINYWSRYGYNFYHLAKRGGNGVRYYTYSASLDEDGVFGEPAENFIKYKRNSFKFITK